MRIIALCSYPIESAATRFRLAQFIDPLKEHGIDLTIKPFIDNKQFRGMYTAGGHVRKSIGLAGSIVKRIGELHRVASYDLLLVQREAMFFGPGIFEWLFQKLGRVPMVLDLDDATYVRYISPSYGRVGTALKFFGKTDKLIQRSSLVICGNRFIAEHAESRGAKSIVVPTVADTNVFRPASERPKGIAPTIGWIGTHSTFPFLRSLFPLLERLAEKHKFVLKVVGASEKRIKLKGVELISASWSLENEVSDFQSLDVGLYPIIASGSASDQWIRGKSGFKAIQYMAVGVPFVMSPVGVCGEIGVNRKTHFNAETDQEWFDSLDRLLADSDLRRTMGAAGRKFSVSNFSLPTQAKIIADELRKITEK